MFMRRFIQLQIGLLLYGASLALMVRADLGLNPWSVLHQGLSERTGISLGMIVNLVGLLVLLVWIPLRQKPGVGTICNVLLIGTAADVALWALPPIEGLGLRIAFLTAAIVLNGAATAAYIGAGLGPGPRDGLTTGLVRISGWRIGWARTAIEVAVLAMGWLLGGVAGVGTVLYALANGPLVQWFMARFEIAPKAEAASASSI